MSIRPRLEQFIAHINSTTTTDILSTGESYYINALKPNGVEQMIRLFGQVPIFYCYGEKWHVVFPSRTNLNKQVTISSNDDDEYVLHSVYSDVRGRTTICSWHEVDKEQALELIKRVIKVLINIRHRYKDLIDDYILRLCVVGNFNSNDLQQLGLTQYTSQIEPKERLQLTGK